MSETARTQTPAAARVHTRILVHGIAAAVMAVLPLAVAAQAHAQQAAGHHPAAAITVAAAGTTHPAMMCNLC